jgi:hypothetical protein
MDGFFLTFQHRLNGIVAGVEVLHPPCQKLSRHLNTFRGLAERDALFVLEMLHHHEEGQLAPCSVPHVHLPQNAAGLDKTQHGMQLGLMGKLGCERVEAWRTPDVHHPIQRRNSTATWRRGGGSFLYFRSLIPTSPQYIARGFFEPYTEKPPRRI